MQTDLVQETNRVVSFFGVPADQPVKECFPCSLKGHGNGKLYLSKVYICFIGKGAFKKASKFWQIQELLDLSTEGKSLRISSVDGKSAIFTGFVDGQEGCERSLRAVKRVLYGMNGNSILHAAVDDLDYPKVKQILEHDATRLLEANRTAQTPLIIACVKNDKTMVASLLDFYKKAKVDINHYTKGFHVLHAITAMAGIDDAILESIIEFPGINVNAEVAHDKTTPLHYFCANSGSLDCKALGELFFKHGAKPNATTLQNETPLHKAMFNKKVRILMVEMMLKAGANPDMQGGVDGDTPLIYAIRLKRFDLVKCLLGTGASVDIQNKHELDALGMATREYERSDSSEKSICLQIRDLVQWVKQLNAILIKIDLLEYSKVFIAEGFHDAESFAQLDDRAMKEIGIKLAGRQKLSKELEAIKTKQAGRTDVAQKMMGVSDVRSTSSRQLDAAAIRESLNMDQSGRWEIPSDEIEFTAKLGSGTSGQVFRGLYKGHEVAIKVLNASNFDNELDEFRKEFDILRKVNDPHMVTFYGAVIDKNLCMVMELCEHGSLHDLLKKKEFKLSFDLALKFGNDMAEGLAVLHNHNPPIIHRDLKSLNLLVTKQWSVKLCDFGLSRLVQGDLKTFNRLCGTYAYIAPEMMKGAPATDKSDVFSMGIVLWELIQTATTGSYMAPYAEFGFAMDVQIMVKSSSEGLRPTVPDGAPCDFVSVFEQCCLDRPEDRPAAQDVSKKLIKVTRVFQEDKAAWLSKVHVTVKVEKSSTPPVKSREKLRGSNPSQFSPTPAIPQIPEDEETGEFLGNFSSYHNESSEALQVRKRAGSSVANSSSKSVSPKGGSSSPSSTSSSMNDSGSSLNSSKTRKSVDSGVGDSQKDRKGSSIRKNVSTDRDRGDKDKSRKTS